jgi:glycosyltransferase involved in cell wall biosynthesis
VCVNYDDFLDITLPINKKHFDKIHVVTHPDDDKTIEVCERHEVDYITTTRMYEGPKDKFNKGKALNEGIKAMSKKGWLVITDADMIFSENTRKKLELQALNTQTMYGVPRLICQTYKDWEEYLTNNQIVKTWVREFNHIGYFQMIHFNSRVMQEKTKLQKWYTEDIGHCGDSDRWFMHAWRNRRRLKKLFGIHLGESCTNWRGRITGRFQPPPPPLPVL